MREALQKPGVAAPVAHKGAVPQQPASGDGESDPIMMAAALGWRPLQPGETVGPFRIVKRLGGGGMGDVYQALEIALERTVALKVPRLSARDGDEVLQRFIVEAKAVAKLLHPNLCTIFNLGESDGVRWFAMRFIEGENLADILKESEASGSPFSAGEAVQIAAKIAEAMAYAHGKGILHRDLKPANVMFEARSGEPIVMDFGLARPLEASDRRLTKSGATLGTPAYMPLEQANGELDEIGPASDVYSLGAVLYEMLAGRPPVAGMHAQMLAQLLEGKPLPPSQVRPVSDAALDAICLKALSKRPEDRFSTMEEFAVALKGWNRGRLRGGEGPVRKQVDVKPAHLRRLTPALPKVAGLPPPASVGGRSERRGLGHRAIRNLAAFRPPTVIILAGAALMAALTAGGFAAWLLQSASPPEVADADADLPRARDTSEFAPPAETFQQRALYRGHTYEIVEEAVSWRQARARCKARGGYLVVVNDVDEQKFLQELLIKSPAENVYLGATDEAREGRWRWVDGGPLDYRAWRKGQPNDVSDRGFPEDFAVMIESFDGAWMDGEENGYLSQNLSADGYICEWDGIAGGAAGDAGASGIAP